MNTPIVEARDIMARTIASVRRGSPDLVRPSDYSMADKVVDDLAVQGITFVWVQ